jgi:uncharacterized protein
MARKSDPPAKPPSVRQEWLRRMARAGSVPRVSGTRHFGSVASWIAKSAIVLAIALLLAEVLVALAMVLGIRSAPPPLPESVAVAAREHGGAQALEIRTRDGISLRGDVLGDLATQPVIVLAHGYRQDRRYGDPLALRLLAVGYAVVAFDFRGSGASDGLLTGGGAKESLDVEAVVDHLRTRRRVAADRIGVVAFSMGAVATIEAAPRLPKLGAVVLVAPYASLEEAIDIRSQRWLHVPARPLLSPALYFCELLLGVDPVNVAPERHIAGLSPTPVLLVAAGSDWRVPVSVVRRIHAASGAPRALEVFEGLDHDGAARLPPELCDRVLSFLSKTPLGVRVRARAR